jgi:hypothetical protein
MTVLDCIPDTHKIIDTTYPVKSFQGVVDEINKEMLHLLDPKWGAYRNLRNNLLRRVEFLIGDGNLSLETLEYFARMDNNDLLDLVGMIPLTDDEYPLW